jgi:uncharacterized hydrophobic protein (TIGR00271 family)
MNLLFDFINLHNGEEDKEKVLQNVKANTSFRGSNLWILSCAIVIASIGLNVNSTAVIIGAMLISPLMGPIVGLGFALAIYDSELLKKSGKNLFIATIVSLLVATLYFYISPFKETQSELLARTAPNIYDVLIAFFGGLVGVIALTRVEKGNPIPGVAIATALMPPLCTAGYGLAVGKYTYFFGAFYLYSINCFFICIATFFIVKYLKYQPVSHLDERTEKRIRYSITSLIFIMIIPSFYLAYTLFQEKKYVQKVEQFIESEFVDQGYVLIYKDIQYNSKPRRIEVAFLTKIFSPEEIESFNQHLERYDIHQTELIVRQETKDLKGEILSELGVQNKKLSDKDVMINNLQKELSFYQFNQDELYKEIAILFPEIKDISMGRHQLYTSTDSASWGTVVLYEPVNKKDKVDTEKLQQWLERKLNTKKIDIVHRTH